MNPFGLAGIDDDTPFDESGLKIKSIKTRRQLNEAEFESILSIVGSLAIWFLTGGEAAESKAHAERFGIFVGLWAPTFFALSGRLQQSSQ